MLVSVIMPTYNTDHSFLFESVSSILKQSYKNFEFIIVDDCSNKNDNYSFIADNFKDKRIRLFRNSTNSGVAATLNRALEYANGDLIVRMDSDDVAKKNRISKLVNMFKKNKSLCVVGSYAKTFGCKKGILSYPKQNNLIRASLFINNPFCHPTVAYKKSIVENVGYYSCSAPNEDYDLWARLSFDKSVVFMNIPVVLLKYRIHNNQVTNVDYDKLKSNTKNILATIYSRFYPNESGDINFDSFVNALYNGNLRSSDVDELNKVFMLLFKSENKFDNSVFKKIFIGKYKRIFMKQVITYKHTDYTYETLFLKQRSGSLFLDFATLICLAILKLRKVNKCNI